MSLSHAQTPAYSALDSRLRGNDGLFVMRARVSTVGAGDTP